jgi:periplasmic protein TonB
MPRASLSQLYFESISVSKAPLTWLLCAAFIHAGLFCIPTGKHKPSESGIVFHEGNAGIEVELMPESPESAPDQTLAPPDSSRDSIMPSPDPDPVVAEAEDVVSTKTAATAALHPPGPKTNRGSDRALAALPRAGSAIAQPAAQVYTTQPPYPPRARELGVEGVVRLQVRIGVDGCPRQVKIVRPSGRSDFDFSSVSTVQREWRFRPARTAAGVPVESTIVVAIKFTLKS